MPGRSFVIYRIEHLCGKGTVKTEPHRPSGSHDPRSALVFTRLDVTDAKVARGYSEAVFHHRESMHIEGLWRDQKIREFVGVFKFPAYYSRAKKLFIIEAKRELAKDAVRRLARECRDQVQLRPVRLDSEAVLDSAAQAPVLGAWSVTNVPGDIRSRAFFDDDLGAQPDFRRMCATGQLSSVRLEYPFENESLTANISRWGSACVFGEPEIETCLRFMEHLASFEK